ncbi:MAG TPA: hypothetical protein VGT41_05910 [Candidatus Babeliales bacterium]|nr:hypothetical protein [Candidatus Babeliales bacterium]
MKLLTKTLLLTSMISISAITANNTILNALALCASLPQTTVMSHENAFEYTKQALRATSDGDYEKSLATILHGLEKFPQSFTLQTYLAISIAHFSKLYNEPFKNILEKISKTVFDKLMNEVDEQPKADSYNFKNEYFHRFGMYLEQYEAGIAMMYDYWRTPEWTHYAATAYYRQAVGATCHAKELLLKGKRKHALIQAQTALVAWAQHFNYADASHNALVHYALALGILGYRQEMMHALHQSAHLINKDLDYIEFQEIITFINAITPTPKN